MNRRGALLLEAILSLGLLVAGASAVFVSLAQAQQSRSIEADRVAAGDLARSVASLLEAGLLTEAALNGEQLWPADLLSIEAEPDGLAPVGVRTFWVETDAEPGEPTMVRVYPPSGPSPETAPLAETVALTRSAS